MKLLLIILVPMTAVGIVWGLFVARTQDTNSESDERGSVTAIRNGIVYFQNGDTVPMPRGGVHMRSVKIKDILESESGSEKK